MHAIRLHAFGPADNLRYEEVDDPEPGAGQVRIAVSAAGVHLIDTSLRAGHPIGPLPLPDLPAIPGREVAGTVDALGEGVASSWLGARVVAHLGPASGGYATRAVCDVERLHVIPEGASDAAAVTMIGTGRASMAILDRVQIVGGDVVVVTAAAGGIGSLLVQAARNAEATVVAAVGGPVNVAHARAQGADIVVDYDVAGLGGDGPVRTRRPGGDCGPGRGGRRQGAPGTRAPRPRRTAVALRVVVRLSDGADEHGPLRSRDHCVGRHRAGASQTQGPIRRLEEHAMEALVTAVLVPVVGQNFPLAQAAEAHRAIESRATVGKTVLVP